MSAAVNRQSASWPGAWSVFGSGSPGIEETRFTWAVLRAGTNELIFTSADAHVNPAGPAA